MHTISSKDISNHYKLSSIIGKKVIAENGEIVGRVKDVAFSMNKIIGLFVKAMGIDRVLIDITYVDQFDADAVTLKINPVTSLVGKLVFDKDGKKIGKVIQIIRKTNINEFSEAIVKKGAFSRIQRISKSDMAVIDKNIILKKIM